ncbi:MAG: hydantoinase B/oxoprolinase family protein, partial [Deltaproteobacteria bacterium]|nr:hydantoinase B/oxoprolinase family protein [Deltaproteobacteria bacterium]
GYGDALERDPEAILKDLRDGMVNPWVVRNVYKVVYEEQTLRLDREKTEALRAQMREKRKARAKSYDEFERDWRKLHPSDSVIKYYGPYPVPEPA